MGVSSRQSSFLFSRLDKSQFHRAHQWQVAAWFCRRSITDDCSPPAIAGQNFPLEGGGSHRKEAWCPLKKWLRSFWRENKIIVFWLFLLVESPKNKTFLRLHSLGILASSPPSSTRHWISAPDEQCHSHPVIELTMINVAYMRTGCPIEAEVCFLHIAHRAVSYQILTNFYFFAPYLPKWA